MGTLRVTDDAKATELRLLEAVARGAEADFWPECDEKTDASGGASWGGRFAFLARTSPR